jgi:hypothetical protein
MDCRAACLLLEWGGLRLRELEPDDRAALDAHLADCAACRELTARREGFDRGVATALRAVAVPPGLKDRILTRLGNERSARQRGRLRWAALAAAVLVAAAAAITLFHQSARRPLDLDALAQVGETPPPRDAEDLRQRYLARYGVPLELPAELADRWDLGLLAEFYRADEQGQSVPTLVFRKGQATATVRLLAPRQYRVADLEAFDKNYPDTRRVLGRPGEDRVVALVVIERGKYEDFLRSSRQHTA